MAKGIPCHITKIGPEQDVVTVSFDIKGYSWAVPQRKIPVAFSPYARDALTVGDKGLASPADYNISSQAGLGGGVADFSPRGNLTPLAFHPISKTSNEKRDNDQYVVTGGKNGVSIFQSMQPKSTQTQTQQTGQQPSGASQTAPGASRARVYRMVPGKGFTAATGAPRDVAAPSGGTTTSPTAAQPQAAQAQAGKNMASMVIDKNGMISHTSPNGQMSLLIDQQGQRVAINPGTSVAYLGGDGRKGMYMPIVTIYGPAYNTWARVG